MSQPPRTSPWSWPENKRAALSLTFDDARLSQTDTGIALLNRLGVRATFFVSFGGLECRREAWLDAIASGHEIGNHTVHHPCSAHFGFARANPLEDYTLQRMEEELLEANQRIEQLLGVVPTSFAYPCGQKFVGRGEASRSYVPLVARHFIAGRGFRDECPNDPLLVDLARCMGVDSDRASLEQLKSWVDMAVASGAWLVFVSHEIAPSGRQALHPAVLEGLCHYADECGVWLDTVTSVASYIKQVIG